VALDRVVRNAQRCAERRGVQEAAAACIEGLKQSGCTGVNPEIPAVCEDVWSLCPYPRIPPVSTDVFAPPA
jgi:hypothetical protein